MVLIELSLTIVAKASASVSMERSERALGCMAFQHSMYLIGTSIFVYLYHTKAADTIKCGGLIQRDIRINML